ncbi:hypothetical protein FXO38_14014 [Capsicum annuum]|nr:hypothetical protein FXO38_14014 [Capsicum annuum]
MGSMFNDADNKLAAPFPFSSEDEDIVVSKKVFEKYREEVREELKSIHDLVSTRCDQIMNAINKNKQIDVCFYYLRKKSKYDFNSSYKCSTVDCNFMNIVNSVLAVYKVNDASLNAGGKEYHLNEYISGFPICIYVYDSFSSIGHDVVVPEIEKLAEVIPICLLAYKFYEKKDIDIDNNPNYKFNHKMDLFVVSVKEDLPQQLSGSLDCGLYMVTYAECLTFGEAIPSIDFDPDLIRIRYDSLLWNYGSRKEETKAQSDDEAPMRPPKTIRIIKDTEVHYI